MLHLLRSELFRLRKRPQSWILFLIMFLSTGGLYVAFAIAAIASSDADRIRDELVLSRVFQSGMQFGSLVGFILIVVMSAGLIGNEYGWNTIRPLIARSPGRGALLTAKWITVAICTVALFLFGLVVAIVFSAVTSAIAGNFEGVSGSLLGDWAVSFGRLVISNAPYAALAFTLALVARSNAAGISVGLGLAFVEPLIWALLGLLSDRFDSVAEFGIAFGSDELANMNGQNELVSTGEAWRAVILMAVYTAIFVVISYAVFRRRDVTSG